MSYWLFKCDPKRYRLSSRLIDSNPSISWLVTRYRTEIKPGDSVFLMETGPKRAIRALMRVDTAPDDLPELEHELQYWVGPESGTRCRVRGTLIKRVELPVSSLEGIAELQGSPMFRGQGTNFRVTDGQGQYLMSLVDGNQ